MLQRSGRAGVRGRVWRNQARPAPTNRDSLRRLGTPLPLRLAARGEALLELPCLPLAAGRYRLAGGFRTAGRWLGYRTELLQLSVTQARQAVPEGLVMIPGRLSLGS